MKIISSLVLAVILLSVGCKEPEDSETKPKWLNIEALSVKDVVNTGNSFTDCAVDNDEMLLMSLDKFVRVDVNDHVVDSRDIDTKNFIILYKGGFLSKDFYVLANYLKLSTKHLVDSLQFDFYSTKIGNITPISIHTKIFPNSDKFGYQIPTFQHGYYFECCALNSNNQLGIMLTSYFRNPYSNEGYHHLAIFDLNITQNGINPVFNKLIDILDFPWNGNFYSLKSIGTNFYLTTCDYGTYVINPSGEIHNNENIGALFSYNGTIFQFSHNTVYSSLNGIDWNYGKSVDEGYVFELSVVDNYAVDYSNGPATFYSLPDFTNKIINSEGIPTRGDCYFFEEFNNKIYLSNWNGGIYSIKKSDLFK